MAPRNGYPTFSEVQVFPAPDEAPEDEENHYQHNSNDERRLEYTLQHTTARPNATCDAPSMHLVLRDAAEAVLRGDELAPTQEIIDLLQKVMGITGGGIREPTQPADRESTQTAARSRRTSISALMPERSDDSTPILTAQSLKALRAYLPIGPAAAETLRICLQKALDEHHGSATVGSEPSPLRSDDDSPPEDAEAKQEMRALSLSVGLNDDLWENNSSDNSVYNSSRPVHRATDFISHSWRDNGHRKTQMLRSFLFLQEYVATVLAGTILAWLLLFIARAQELVIDITVPSSIAGVAAVVLIVWASCSPLRFGPFQLSSRTVWLVRAPSKL